MTDTEINIAIAEMTGAEHGLCCHAHGLVTYDRAIPHQWQGVQAFKCPWCKSDLQQISPNYTGDLNATHEAEKLLITPDLEKKWITALALVVHGKSPRKNTSNKMVRATAAQRAEALLRVFGKGKEDA